MAKTEAKPRPLPKPTPATQAFWDGAKKGKLMLQWDPRARKYQFWPRENSVHTGRRNLQWKATSGKGELYSYTVTYVPTPGFENRVEELVNENSEVKQFNKGLLLLATMSCSSLNSLPVWVAHNSSSRVLGNRTPNR